MKKTLVALAVLAAAGSAQAIELYNADKVSVNMTGDVEVVYKQGLNDGAEFKQDIQDADFGFDTRYAMNDDLQVGAFWEFKGADTANTKGAQVGDVYVGLYSQSAGSIKFGKQTTALDDAGIGGDYQFGISSFFQNGTPFAGHEVVKYEIDQGTFYATIAYMQDKNGYNGLGKNGNFFDAKLGGRVADFDITAFYGQAKIERDASTTTVIDQDTGYLATTNRGAFEGKDKIFAFEVRYSGLENTNLAVGYYNNKVEEERSAYTGTVINGSTSKAPYDAEGSNQTFALSGDYTLNAWTFGAGVSNTKLKDDLRIDEDAKDSYTSWYVNAGYALAPSTTAYAEVGGNNFYGVDSDGFADYDLGKTQTGFAVGIKAEF
jgi:predicted porin